MTRKAQVLKCKCGKVFAACIEPECYTDKEWQKKLREYVLKGATVEILETPVFTLESCVCKKKQKVNTLFD